MSRSRSHRVARRRGVGCLVLVVVLALVGVLAWSVLRRNEVLAPLPGQQRCVATANDTSVTVDLDQAHYASIIAAVATDRGLPPRAVTIALATAYQESGIRNLDYGDRDSIGLFQQRPSQGWGTVAQISDPVYSAGKFYDALVKIDNWQTDDVNDVAQRVQRSGHPEAYRDHEADGRVLASVLTGYSPAGLRCLERTGADPDAVGLAKVVENRFGAARVTRSGSTVTVRAGNARQAWAYAHFGLANLGRYGVASVQVGDRLWTSNHRELADWGDLPAATDAGDARTVIITLRP